MQDDGNRQPGLAGRTVIVTGAASGIGAAAARLLRASGAQVVAVDRNPAAFDDYVFCDLADPAAISAAVAQLPPAVDGLVNAAGLPGTHREERVFAVNFLGLRELSTQLLPRILAGGSIVHVASTAGSQWGSRLPALLELLDTGSFADGLAWFGAHRVVDVPAYNLSKEAVCVYTMRSAPEAVARGIRVNALCPGPVRTPILEDFVTSMGAARLEWARDVAGRYAEPEDIAPVIAFLISPASAWINGVTMVADGGVTGAVVSGWTSPPAGVGR
jgi:NAD(P)-dependent dehydrogenase (short-subunit alcohol dehydrogenase family)